MRPTVVVLSTTGRMVRVDLADGQELTAPDASQQARRDPLRRRSTTRGDIGAVTTAGRLVRFSPVDLPVGAARVGAARRRRRAARLPRHPRRRARRRPRPRSTTTRRSRSAPRTASSSASAVELRCGPSIEVIGLKAGDRVVGAAPAPDDTELVFVTSDAQLLRFAAAAVRPQGAPAGGMAGIKLVGGCVGHPLRRRPRARIVVAVTISGADGVLPGTDAGRGEGVAVRRVPGQGPRDRRRARARVPARRDAGSRSPGSAARPALAVGPDGATRTLPAATAKRDASGLPLEGVDRLDRPPARPEPRCGSRRRRRSRWLRRRWPRATGGATSSTMNSRRGATSLPISSSKTGRRASASSRRTRRRVRPARSIVVVASCSASISPSPL